MAVIGVSIGASFVLALLLGPLLEGMIGVRGLFLRGVALALPAIALVVLDAGVFRLHALLTALRRRAVPAPRRARAARRRALASTSSR
jgi:hypothetical protein